MQRNFFTHDKKFVSDCNCYLEAHMCPVLKGLKYDTQYNRSTNTENIYVDKPDFQKPVFNGHYYCAREHRRPTTEIQFFSNDGVWGTKCAKQILSCYPNEAEKEIQECAMINKLKENNIPFCFKMRSHYEYFFADPLIEIWIGSNRLDQLYIFDKWSILGTCAGCKWHEPWHEHDCLPKQTISCDNCSVSVPEKCPAKQMLIDGYTECESKIKCISLLHAQFIKEKYKDNQLHI